MSIYVINAHSITLQQQPLIICELILCDVLKHSDCQKKSIILVQEDKIKYFGIKKSDSSVFQRGNIVNKQFKFKSEEIQNFVSYIAILKKMEELITLES